MSSHSDYTVSLYMQVSIVELPQSHHADLVQ